jgi:hypothetical protein
MTTRDPLRPPNGERLPFSEQAKEETGRLNWSLVDYLDQNGQMREAGEIDRLKRPKTLLREPRGVDCMKQSDSIVYSMEKKDLPWRWR